MDAYENLTCEEFATDVFILVLCEMECLRADRDSEDRVLNRQMISEFPPFYQRIGKAACYFALRNRQDIKLVMNLRGVDSRSHSNTLNDFITTITQRYFHGIDLLPEQWFPDQVLLFCGFIGAVADCFPFQNNFIEVCLFNLEQYLHSRLEVLQDAGGWQSIYDAAEMFAEQYDLQFLNNINYNRAELRDD